MKTKFFFVAIIIIIIAVLHYYGVNEIILTFCLGVVFVTWIFIDCDPDEEDSGSQKLFWLLSSIILFALCCLLSYNIDNKDVKNAVEFASYISGLNFIFSLLKTI